MRAELVLAIALGTGACDELFGLDEIQSDAGIQPGDLLLAYAFEDPVGSTMIVDDSGNGNAAQNFGPTLELGRYGSGLGFDGVDDHAVAPNSPSIDIAGAGFTIAAWVRVEMAVVTSDETIIGKLWAPLGTFAEPYYQYGLEYVRDTNSIALLLPDAAGVNHETFPLGGVSGSFQHVAFSYDGMTVRGFIDGAELFTAPAAVTVAKRDTQLVLGVDGLRKQPFHGALDNVRIYQRALTAAEIVEDRDTARTINAR